MKQLVGVEYQEPELVSITIMESGIRVNIDDRCVFVIMKAKKFEVNDTRKKSPQ